VVTWTNPLPTPAAVKVCIESSGREPPTNLLLLGRIPGATAIPTEPAGSGRDNRSLEATRRTPRTTGTAVAAPPQPSAAAAQPPQAVTVAVAAGGSLQLPVSFCPVLLQEAAAVVTVELLDAKITAPGRLVWRFPVKGVAQADTGGISFS
jgi:hypothetical protein